MHFLVEMPEKGKKNVFREKNNNKQNSAVIFRCWSDSRNIKITFLDPLNKEVTYSVCISRLKTQK